MTDISSTLLIELIIVMTTCSVSCSHALLVQAWSEHKAFITKYTIHYYYVLYLLYLLFKYFFLVKANAFYKSKCFSVCLFVCLCVCSLLMYRLTNILPPLPKVGCQKFLEIRNSRGKRNGKKWSQILKLILIKGVKSPRKKKCFFGEFCLLHII